MLNKLKQKICSLYNSLPGCSFKIIDFIDDSDKRCFKLRYRILGTSMTVLEPIQHLYRALVKIEGFSKRDSELILQLHELEGKAPELFIKNITFSHTGPLFDIFDRQLEVQFRLSLKSIFKEKILHFFGPADIQTLAYFIVEQNILKEKQAIEKLTQQSNLQVTS